MAPEILELAIVIIAARSLHIPVMDVKNAELCYLIHGYHVYKNIWILALGKMPTTRKKEHGFQNIHDRFACGIYFVGGLRRGRCIFEGGIYLRLVFRSLNTVY